MRKTKYPSWLLTRVDSLSDLLDQAEAEFGLRRRLIDRVVGVERVNLYLIESSKQSVRNRIRELIQEEAALRAAHKA